jgi:hypothetical protein
MIPMRHSPVVFFATLVLTVVVPATRPARAANPTMSECLSANESAIKLRGDHKLRQARDQALACSASTCPDEVRETCQLRVRDLNAAIPTIVFLAKDGAGHDIVAVRVSMDDEPIGDRLDGTAIAVDPGQHKFSFEAAGQAPVERSLVISEGQKDRREAITLGASATGASAPPTSTPTPATPTPPTPNPAPAIPGVAAVPPASSDEASSEPAPSAGPPGRSQRLAGIVVGAAGVVGLAVGAVFGIVATSDWSSAKAACNGKPVSCTTSPSSPGFQDEGSAKTMATISTVGFIAGGVLAAGGVVVFLTAPRTASSEVPAATRGADLVPSLGPGGTGMMLRGWF